MNGFCKSCGAALPEGERFCGSCGAPAQDGQSGAGWVRATDETPMTHCDKCNRQVPLSDNISRCPYCGAEIHEPTGPLCPRCGTQQRDDERKCVVCGAEIPGRYDGKPTKEAASWLVYRRPNGLMGLSIVGKLVLAVLALAILGIIALVKLAGT